MKDEFELRIGPGGIVESVYQDGLADAIGAKTEVVERASNVEWETDGKTTGWTVRSASKPDLALRQAAGIVLASDFTRYDVVFFQTREKALEAEVTYFWELYACTRHRMVGCMACRYGEGPLAEKPDYISDGTWHCGNHKEPLVGGRYGYCIACEKASKKRTRDEHP